ncbi:MAG: DJ-1/PfpI family protein [Erysipelotrichaceae bacterium]|nr:DJ-1/PfpI family protein [Erysipelotrichaceae bacterium]
MKAVVLFKDGFEEVEALTPVDVLRRANVPIDMVGMDSITVKGSHGIEIKMDKVFDDEVYNADIVILPGGLPGATSLRDDKRVIDVLKVFNEKNKLIAAICAGPISLEKAGVVKDKLFTCYPGFELQIPSGKHRDTLVCVGDNIITGRGPAAAMKFSYRILEKLGVPSEKISDAMQYPYINK